MKTKPPTSQPTTNGNIDTTTATAGPGTVPLKSSEPSTSKTSTTTGSDSGTAPVKSSSEPLNSTTVADMEKKVCEITHRNSHCGASL